MRRGNVGCKADGCNEKHQALGFCKKHWTQWRRLGRILKPGEKKTNARPRLAIARKCKIFGCVSKHYAHDFCKRHFAEHCKQKAVDYKGGRCQLCGYNNHIGSLQFHHKNPEGDAGIIGRLLGSSWPRLKKELDKCVLLCANCHFEVHHTYFELEKVA